MALGMIGEVQAIKEERKVGHAGLGRSLPRATRSVKTRAVRTLQVDIDIRVGVHTGTAIGGIIGTAPLPPRRFRQL